MSGENENPTENEKISFYARIWTSGDRCLVPIRKELAKVYNLKGKFVKVDLEVLGEWK